MKYRLELEDESRDYRASAVHAFRDDVCCAPDCPEILGEVLEGDEP